MNDVNKKVDSIREFFKKNQPKNHPIENHPIGECEEYVKNLYFDMLCVIAQYENEDVENQNKFIERIMTGSNETMPISEHIKRAMSITVDTITEFIKQCKDNHLNEIFFIDSLIISCGNGTPNRKQVEFLSELADVFGFDKKKVNYLSNLALSILEQDSEKYQLTNEPYNQDDKGSILEKISCYAKEFVNGLLVDTSNTKHYYSKTVSDTPLFSENVTISNIDNITIENQLLKDKSLEFSSVKSVTLKNCIIRKNGLRFKGVQQVSIEGCFFDFERIYNCLFFLFDCKITINNSKFINYYNDFTDRNDATKYSHGIINGSRNCVVCINNCTFENCYKNDRYAYSGTIVGDMDSIVKVNNSYFTNCTGRHLFFKPHYSKENCTFINCCPETSN